MTEVNTSLEPEVVVSEQPIESVEPVVVQPEEQPELVYEYQPMDDLNRPLGGRQVLKYKTQQELIEKLTKQNTELVKLNRKLKTNNLLGTTEKVNLPENVALSEVYAQPRELSLDEKVQLSRDIIDPEKYDEATDRLFEAKLGAKPNRVRARLEAVDMLLARSECDAFLNSEPRYYKCPENFETLSSWMVKNNLAPTRENFSIAFNRLNESDYLISAPIVREEAKVEPVVQPTVTVANSQPPVEQPSRITSEEPPQVKRPVVVVSSGLTRNDSSNDGIPVSQRNLTLAEIDKMPANVYRERLKDPAFKKAVDDLLTPKPIHQ